MAQQLSAQRVSKMIRQRGALVADIRNRNDLPEGSAREWSDRE
jgi:hypothetical protein